MSQVDTPSERDDAPLGTVWDEWGVRVRDLAAEARDRKVLARNAEVKCTRCGCSAVARTMRAHQKHPRCVSAFNETAEIEAGRMRVPMGSVVFAAAKAAGIAQTALTSWSKARGHEKQKLVEEAWAPRWLGRAFSTSDAWALTEGMGFDAAVPRYAALMRSMAEAPHVREAVEATFALGGAAAVRAIVYTPQMRAQELRKNAAAARARADALDSEANELDPPGAT